MTVDINGNLKAFLDDRDPGARYASFDYCFNHFQAARESGNLARLGEGDGLLLSCLQLGFYLASWGMMRGSGDLLQRSMRRLIPVVETIIDEPAATWALDAHSYSSESGDVLELSKRIRSAFKDGARDSNVGVSDTLVTKTMLGVFGCVPAFDRYFRIGFGCETLCRSALVRIGKFYADNRSEIDAQNVFTLDFASGRDTQRRYSRAKIIDMIFFQEGIQASIHH